VQDLLAAVDYLRTKFSAPALLIGHSLGGAAVLAAAPQVAEAVGVVTIGAPASASHVTHNFAAQLDEIETKGVATVSLAGRPFTIKKQFLDDLANHDFLERLAGLKKGLLICHAPRDEYVNIDNASAIFTAARHPKSFISLDTADHLLRKREDAVYVADVIAAWASRYLHAVADDAATALPPGIVEVSETRTGALTQLVRAGRHRLPADEPVKDGGNDAGPGPYDYLLAALGACTSMTIALYARRKRWPLDGVTVTLRHSRVHAADCASCETNPVLLDRIDREIEVRGPLAEEQRARLLDIANKCPVHRTLTSRIDIQSRLV
jgi:putative redox protein